MRDGCDGRQRLVIATQIISIWLGKALVDHGYATGSGLRAVWWSPTNWPLVILGAQRVEARSRSDVPFGEALAPLSASLICCATSDILAYAFGITLAILLVMHTYMACTSTTTYEFLKLEKLSYLEGFYEFSCPFSEGEASRSPSTFVSTYSSSP